MISIGYTSQRLSFLMSLKVRPKFIARDCTLKVRKLAFKI
jgi:hypothetical protein